MTAQESHQDAPSTPLGSGDVQPGGEAQRRSEGASCSGCPARWTGANRAHCSNPRCHRTFAGVGLFDRHRVGYRCVDPATLPGMEFRDGLWRGPEATEDQRAALKDLRKVADDG